MPLPSSRLVLTGAAIVALATGGIGLAAAASAPPAQAPAAVSAEATRSPAASGELDRRAGGERLAHRGEAWGARLLRIGRHMVHVEATITDREGNLITIWLDHGTIAALGDGSVTVSEAGGGSRSMSIDDQTRIYVGRDEAELEDVTVGDEVFVQSRLEDGTPIARRIVVVPARAG